MMNEVTPTTTAALEARLQPSNLEVMFAGQPAERALDFQLPILDSLVEFLAYYSEMRPPMAIKFLQMLGGATSSVVRHLVATGRPASAVYELVPGLENVLVRLGRIAELPPRDSAPTTWLIDDGFRFTGVTGEREFGKSVRTINDLLVVAANALGVAASGDLDWHDVHDQLVLAGQRFRELTAEYNSFRRKDHGTPYRMSVAEFVLGMRDFLGEQTVKGDVLSGPNAAFIPGATRIDVVLGTADASFVMYLDNAKLYLPKRDRQKLEKALALPSMLDHLVAATGNDVSTIVNADVADVAAAVEKLPKAYSVSVMTYRAARSAYASASSAHMQAIYLNLTDLDKKLSPSQLDRLVVPTEKGTGGAGHAATERLGVMRASSAAEDKLVEAVKLADVADGEQAAA